MTRATELGFRVAKPWGDCAPYDIIIRLGLSPGGCALLGISSCNSAFWGSGLRFESKKQIPPPYENRVGWATLPRYFVCVRE